MSKGTLPAPHLRLPLLVHPVDLATHEHADPAFAPSLLAAEEVGDEEGEAWQGGSRESRGKCSQGGALSGFSPIPIARPQFAHLYNGHAGVNQSGTQGSVGLGLFGLHHVFK